MHLSKDKFYQKLDELMNARASEGYGLCTCEILDCHGNFVLIVEKEADLFGRNIYFVNEL